MKKILTVLFALTVALSVSACGNKTETADDYADKLVNGEVEPDVEVVEKSEAPETEEKPAVNLAVSDEDMGKLVDAAADDYKSFTIQSIDSPDFFVGKQLRVVATIQDHQMTNVYASCIETKFTNDSLEIKYTSDGEQIEQRYIVYTIADKVAVSPKNRQFSYVAYGDQEISSETTDGTIGIMTLIKMREDIDMGEAAADTYIMLQETSNEGVYEILKVMD
ncbi:MAG: lipoprotein [Candidatus Ornithomonoglobus sp.]